MTFSRFWTQRCLIKYVITGFTPSVIFVIAWVVCNQDRASAAALACWQVVSRLCADDVARLRCTTLHLCVQLSTGRHALQHW